MRGRLWMNESTFEKVDRKITRWMANYGIQSLRISMGIIFIWFGVLKFFKGYSPAEDLAVTTIHILTFNLFTDQVIIYGLAFFETLIGLGLAFKMFLRETLLLLFIQMIGTITPVFLLPDQVFNIFPFSLTLEGQYIVKNLVLISAGIVIGATVRGGKIESN